MVNNRCLVMESRVRAKVSSGRSLELIDAEDVDDSDPNGRSMEVVHFVEVVLGAWLYRFGGFSCLGHSFHVGRLCWLYFLPLAFGVIKADGGVVLLVALVVCLLVEQFPIVMVVGEGSSHYMLILERRLLS